MTYVRESGSNTPYYWLRVRPTCGACGADRYALNGEPIALGDPCDMCGSMSVRMPRKPGQVKGDLK